MNRNVHQLWIGSPFPDHLRRLANTWQQHHPNWEYRLWTQDELDRLETPYPELIAKADKIAPPDAVHQMRSDLYRWAILNQYGGLWADTDSWALRPMDELITAPLVLGWEIQDRWIGSSIIYADKGHPATVAVMQHIDLVANLAPRGTRPNRITGPKAITPILRSAEDVRILDEPVWYPVRWDDPTAADDGEFPDSYAVHGWQHQRDLRGLPACGSQVG